MARPTKSRAIVLLTKSIDEIPGLRELSRDATEFAGWRKDAEFRITHIFGAEGRNLEEFQGISYTPYFPPVMVVGSGVPDRTPKESDYRKSFEKGLERAERMLRSMIKEIGETWEDVTEEQNVFSLRTNDHSDAIRVFVVHGRDDSTRQAVARVIEQLGLEAVILEEQPNQGRTVIEKFEEEAQRAGFAVVLLTPDDEGRLSEDSTELTARARQNAIFELGYFAGALGRDRVCVLKKGDVELPSDIYGVMYIAMGDAGGWKLELVRELKEVGFDVDANALIGA